MPTAEPSPTTAETAVQQIHRYKLAPPGYDGDYSKWEEWSTRFKAYMCLQNKDYGKLIRAAEESATEMLDTDLELSASTEEEGHLWLQMAKDMHYILLSICTDAAATVVRRNSVGDCNGFETYRQLYNRFYTPVGTRSIGYLTALLKPKFDENKFEETFLQWEYDVSRYERDTATPLPDSVKIAILLNETTGALQQHLQLRAGQIYGQSIGVDLDTTSKTYSKK